MTNMTKYDKNMTNMIKQVFVAEILIGLELFVGTCQLDGCICNFRYVDKG